MSFLLDTDVCSIHLKRPGKVTALFLQYTGRLYVSAVTMAELYTWALRAADPPRRLQTVVSLIDDVILLNVTHDVARQFGELRANLLDAGKPRPQMDLFIAATALVHGLMLVTHNTQDYTTIPGLTLQDWVVP